MKDNQNYAAIIVGLFLVLLVGIVIGRVIGLSEHDNTNKAVNACIAQGGIPIINDGPFNSQGLFDCQFKDKK